MSFSIRSPSLPCARISETAFPEPYFLTETQDKIIDDILALLKKHELTSHQSQRLLELLEKIIEKGGGWRRDNAPQQHSKAAASRLSCGIGRMELVGANHFS
jgi:hypothetical protein